MSSCTCPPRKSDCVDCGVNTYKINDYYMLRNGLWAHVARQQKRGMLCICCVERRLGRVLRRSDFSNCTLNRNPKEKRSEILADRLGLVQVESGD